MSNITFILDEEKITLQVNPLKRLIDVLREDLNILTHKEGCGKGECGACSVLIDTNLVNSCLVPIGNVENKKVLTLEGLKKKRIFNLLETAFEDAGAVQCGFCIPGMIMASYALLIKNHNPSEIEIRKALSGNICRCTGYNMIIEAVQLASKRGGDLW